MTIDTFHANIANPAIEYRPELRWWLASGHHTDETLRNEIDTAHRLGFGGMEFLAMPEENISLERYAWGSEEWVHDSKLVVEETTRRGMSVSFTSGTNWSNANLPTIHPDHPAAAKELDYVTEDVKGKRSGSIPQINLQALLQGEHIIGIPAEVKTQSFVAAIAAEIEGNVLDKMIDLSDKVVDGTLDWTAPEGNWRLFFFYMHGTGQTADPSASVNYTINYMDPEGCEALVDYWKNVVLTPDLLKTIANNDRAQMYMDSLELKCYGLGGLFWGRIVQAEFEKRHGYSVIPYLPYLVRVVHMMACDGVFTYEPTPKDKVTIDKVRFDLVNTFTDLYIENTLRPLRAFLNSVNIKLRAEISYGLPFELSRPGTEVDGVETESLEFGAQVDAYRLMSGVAHLFGRQYSSETGAVTRNFQLNHQFYDQIINTQLAVGCTKTVLHGWASMAGAEGTQWPGHEGMWPMFSERFDYRQPGSEFYKLWGDALGRTQFLLRQGRPRLDVGIIRSDHATDNLVGMALKDDEGFRIPEEVSYGRMGMRARENYWWEDLGLQDAGWTYEYFDGELLLDSRVKCDGVVQPNGPGYQALIIYQSTLNPDVAKHILKWAKGGLPVLLVHNTREVKFLARKEYFTYPRAAAYTQGLDKRDDELASTILELLKLPNATEIHDQSETLSALRKLGLDGRSEFVQPNQSVLSHLREDGDRLYLYLYHYLYGTGKPTEVEVSLPEGAVDRVDPHTGYISPYHSAVADQRSQIKVRLSPGETALFIVDTSRRQTVNPTTLSPVAELKDWDLTVESWDAGEIQVIKEDRGLGYVTTEHKPLTAITKIPVGKGPLKPWTELKEVGEAVSGIGEYRSSFRVESAGTYILDLGSTCGALGSVQINDSTPRGFDTSAPKVDVSDLIKVGNNSVIVRVSSSLNNRLRARGYYDRPEIPFFENELGKWKSMEDKKPVRQYGLVGPVVLYAQI